MLQLQLNQLFRHSNLVGICAKIFAKQKIEVLQLAKF